MTDQDPRSLPRVWYAEFINVDRWHWAAEHGKWFRVGADELSLGPHQIFVPAIYPEPTEAPPYEPEWCYAMDWTEDPTP